MQLFPQPEQTITGTLAAFRGRQTTCTAVVSRCLEAVDRCEADLAAWVLIDREAALAQAAALDCELDTGSWRGPLHGIPLGVKDIIDVAGAATRAGSRLPAPPAVADAAVVARLRSAGAIILGKTVTTQYASFDPPQSRNPWNGGHTPGGSSSGSAAAVASGMCLAALGSQTGGSITRPASFCGIFGCKPTWGRVSTQGVLPLAWSLDHVGPLGRSVRDLAVLLDVISGYDPNDPFSVERAAEPIEQALHAAPPPPKLAQLDGPFIDRADDEARDAVDVALAVLRDGGADVGTASLPADFDELIRVHRTIMAVESATVHRRRFAEHADDYLPCIRSLIAEGAAANAVDYASCRRIQAAFGRQVEALLAGSGVLVCPATTGPAPDVSTTGDPLFNSPWSLAGLPTITVPAGLSRDGLPLGLQLVGPRFQEATMFRTAFWCEEALRKWTESRI